MIDAQGARASTQFIRPDHDHSVHEREGVWLGTCGLCIAEMIARGEMPTCEHGRPFRLHCTPCALDWGPECRDCAACADEYAKALAHENGAR